MILVNPTAECGAITFEVEMQDGTALDNTIFTATLDGSLGAIQILETYTTDPAKVGTHNLKVIAYFASFATYGSEKDFTI